MKFLKIASPCALLVAASCASTSTPVQEAHAFMSAIEDKVFNPMMQKKALDFNTKCNSAKPGKETIEVVLKGFIIDIVDKVRVDAKWEDILRVIAEIDGLAGEISKEALAQAAGNKDLDIEAIFQSMKEEPDRYVAAIDAALKSDAQDKPADHKAIVDAVVKEFKQGRGNVLYWVAGVSGGLIVLAGAGSLVYFFFVRPKNGF